MTVKLMLDIPNQLLWDDVKIYKIKNKHKTNNEAVIDLIKRSLYGR